MVDEFSRAWRLPNLSLKAKFYAVLTLESQYMAAPKAEMQQLFGIMESNGVTTRDEMAGFFDFAHCYTGYTRNQHEMRLLMDPEASAPSGSSSPSPTAVAALIFSLFNLAMSFFFIHHLFFKGRRSSAPASATQYNLMPEDGGSS